MSDAKQPEHDLEQIKEAIREGRASFPEHGVESINRMLNTGKRDRTITHAKVAAVWKDDDGSIGMRIEWGTVSIGFGNLTVFASSDGVRLSTECMSKEFALSVLAKLVEGAEVIG